MTANREAAYHPDARVQRVVAMMQTMAHLFPEQTWWQDSGALALAGLEAEGVQEVPTVAEVIEPIMEGHRMMARHQVANMRELVTEFLDSFDVSQDDIEALERTKWFRNR